jgi:hypothetical protein
MAVTSMVTRGAATVPPMTAGTMTRPSSCA